MIRFALLLVLLWASSLGAGVVVGTMLAGVDCPRGSVTAEGIARCK